MTADSDGDSPADPGPLPQPEHHAPPPPGPELAEEPELGEPEGGSGERSDPALADAVRAGDRSAFEVLYTRHVTAARRLALALTRNPADADDLVAEAFAKLLDTLHAGGGPGTAFRAYLLTTVRNLRHDRARQQGRVTVTGDLSDHDPGDPFVDPAVEGMERTLVARAFARLPERWQAVLWHTEVEGDSPATVAPMLGLTPNGVSALAYRARERLRQNYLREHVSTSPTEQCQSTVDRLGAYVRHGLSRRDRTAVDEHLSGCRRCQILYLEVGDVNARLRGVLAPVVLGEAAAVAYLGASSAGGLTAFLTPVWITTKRISRRRSTQAGAGTTAAVAAVAVALALVSGTAPLPGDEGETPEPGPGPGPEAAGPTPGPPGASPAGQPDPGDPSATPQLLDDPPAQSPAVADDPLTLDVTLEPVGTLVRDRPGVLALTVTATVPAGGSGGGAPSGGLAAAGPAPAQPAGAPPETGDLTAEITNPEGVVLRAGTPGGGWSCAPDGTDIRCQGPSLPGGTTSHAYVPVAVSATAAEGASQVRLTGPGIEATAAAADRGVRSDGLAATFAATAPATVLAGGSSLLSCPRLDLTCRSARTGGSALGRVDNGDYRMTRYTDRDAPSGAPRRAAVSGATIRLPGEVVWAGLFWAGSGSPPSSPTAQLHIPGTAGYTPVVADTVRRVDRSDLRQTAYQASAEVTGLVRGTPGGDWWVAVDKEAFRTGVGTFGGWALLVVAEDGGPDRAVTVFDELTPLRDHQSFAAEVHGSPGRARIGFAGWEGDRGRTGTRLLLDDRPLGGTYRNDIAGSRTDGTPSGWNTLGTDARVLEASISDGTQRPVLAASTRDDAWLLGPVVVVAPSPAASRG